MSRIAARRFSVIFRADVGGGFEDRLVLPQDAGVGVMGFVVFHLNLKRNVVISREFHS